VIIRRSVVIRWSTMRPWLMYRDESKYVGIIVV
jgi:hypothetical protein